MGRLNKVILSILFAYIKKTHGNDLMQNMVDFLKCDDWDDVCTLLVTLLGWEYSAAQAVIDATFGKGTTSGSITSFVEAYGKAVLDNDL